MRDVSWTRTNVFIIHSNSVVMIPCVRLSEILQFIMYDSKCQQQMNVNVCFRALSDSRHRIFPVRSPLYSWGLLISNDPYWWFESLEVVVYDYNGKLLSFADRLLNLQTRPSQSSIPIWTVASMSYFYFLRRESNLVWLLLAKHPDITLALICAIYCAHRFYSFSQEPLSLTEDGRLS